jgi:hypothetical protein
MARRARRSVSADTAGKVATFFSFKGGVGRTMALANCAFIAAMNGGRVLVMDWDLEAPGLPYYFRGLIDQRGASKIRKAPGVLDLFWGWRLAVDGARDSADLEERLLPYRSHAVFRTCVHPLIEQHRLPVGAKLDVVTAGAPDIRCPEPQSYAEALSRFNWSEFFERSAGGNLIHEIGRWCRGQYDLILIDSRTGLADVAGICTMQIPDSVYLCFVFNRQNIEGSAHVAASIVEARKDAIEIRAVPMRVSKERPTEEADARARALRELKRAGLDAARVESDLNSLAVPISSAVPYYEALAPFTSSEHAAGDLNWAYMRLTEELLGRELPRLKLDSAWSEAVRARLQPTVTTVEYLRELESADPDRALEEIERFLDGAIDADPSLELEPEYVRALVATTKELIDSSWEVNEVQICRLEDKTLQLIEQMHAIGEGDWRIDFVDAAEEFSFQLNRTVDEHVERLKRTERILSEGNQDGDMLMRRARTFVSMAQMARDREEGGVLLERADRAETLADRAVPLDAPPEEIAYIRAAVADLRGRSALTRGDLAEARAQFQTLLEQVRNGGDRRVTALGAEALLTLADLDSNDEERRAHLMAAIEMQPRAVLRDIERLAQIVTILLDTPDRADTAMQLMRALFEDQRLGRSLPYGRTTDAALRFAYVANQLARAVRDVPPDQTSSMFMHLGEIAGRVLRIWAKRHARPAEDSDRQSDDGAAMIAGYEHLAERLQLGGAPMRLIVQLRDAIAAASAVGQDDDG